MQISNGGLVKYLSGGLQRLGCHLLAYKTCLLTCK